MRLHPIDSNRAIEFGLFSIVARCRGVFYSELNKVSTRHSLHIDKFFSESLPRLCQVDLVNASERNVVVLWSECIHSWQLDAGDYARCGLDEADLHGLVTDELPLCDPRGMQCAVVSDLHRRFH